MPNLLAFFIGFLTGAWSIVLLVECGISVQKAEEILRRAKARIAAKAAYKKEIQPHTTEEKP
jgi:hypothetical protein